MFDGFPIDANLGATALLSITVLLLLLGKIVPVQVLRKLEDAAREKDQTIREQAKQIDALIERVELPARVLQSLRDAASTKSGDQP